MAKREALRELQSRLAERLQAARTQVRGASWLAVECRGQGLLFPLHEAGEIFPFVPALPVPHTRPWFAGVANLRGGLHGVVDLALFLDLPGRPLPEGQRDQARLVALNPALGLNSALLVDRLAGLRSTAQVEPVVVDNPESPAFAGACYRDSDGRMWQEILLSALAEDALFLGIAA
jgi:twitching motility protein PilI